MLKTRPLERHRASFSGPPAPQTGESWKSQSRPLLARHGPFPTVRYLLCDSAFILVGRCFNAAVGAPERSAYPLLNSLLGAIGMTLRPKVFCLSEIADQLEPLGLVEVLNSACRTYQSSMSNSSC